jgi:hypothetical protein
MHCRSKFTFFALLATWVVSVSITQAEPLSRDHRDHDEHRGYVLDERYHHNRYYPPRGFVTRALPGGYVTIRHPTEEYFFHEGVWYGQRGPGFVVVAPPVGLTALHRVRRTHHARCSARRPWSRCFRVRCGVVIVALPPFDRRSIASTIGRSASQ